MVNESLTLDEDKKKEKKFLKDIWIDKSFLHDVYWDREWNVFCEKYSSEKWSHLARQFLQFYSASRRKLHVCISNDVNRREGETNEKKKWIPCRIEKWRSTLMSENQNKSLIQIRSSRDRGERSAWLNDSSLLCVALHVWERKRAMICLKMCTSKRMSNELIGNVHSSYARPGCILSWILLHRCGAWNSLRQT